MRITSQSELVTGSPFWPVRDGLLGVYPPLRHAASADVVIMGAGITGALVGQALSEAGADVLILDRSDVASGSTAASSGLLLYETDSPLTTLAQRIGEDRAARVYQLGIDAISQIEALCERLHDDCGFQRRSSLYVASDRRAVKSLGLEHALRKRLGFPSELLTSSEIKARYSIPAPAAIYGAGGSGEIDAFRFTHRLLAQLKARGVRIHDRTAIGAVRPDARGLNITIADGHAVRARKLVCCTGYDAAVRLRRKTGELASTWCVVTEPVDEFVGWKDRCLIWETARPYFYMRTTDDGRVLAGGADERSRWRHRNERVLARKTEALLSRAHRMCPRLELEPAYAWGATFATSPDGLPFIGSVPEWPHVWFALGYGGNGITSSAIAAVILRDAYNGRRHPDAELFAFNRPAVA